jgi:hypothetical protein
MTGDDLGPESPGSNIRLLRLDHFDDAVVSIEDPYGRGLIARLPNEESEAGVDVASPPASGTDSAASDTGDSRDEAAEIPPGFSDAELDEYLDQKGSWDEEHEDE